MKSAVMRRAFIAMAVMILCAVLAFVLKPNKLLADERGIPFDLEQVVPRSFGQWSLVPAGDAWLVNPQTEEALDRIYSQVLTRSYRTNDGKLVMLSIAYGRDQSRRASLQLHYPEACYPAQGFVIRSRKSGQLQWGDLMLPVRRLEAQLGDHRKEMITYWTMTGDEPTLGGYSKKIVEFEYALRGQLVDGLLIRVSSLNMNSSPAFEQNDAFIKELLGAIAGANRYRFVGLPRPGS